MLKPSNYNIFIPTNKDDEVILYNSLNDSVLIIDSETQTIIQNGELTNISKNELSTLKKLGILVNKELDEMKVLRLEYNRIKYNTGFYSLFVILPTFACNLGCSYCYEGSGEVLNKSMNKETAQNVIKFIKSQTVINKSKEILIKLYGGEPLINYPIIKEICFTIMAWAEKNLIGFNVILQTNGTLLNKEIIDEMSPFLNGIELTIDGPKIRHDKTRIYKKDNTGTYDLIINNVKLLLERRIGTITRLNVEDENELRTVLDELTQAGFRENPSFSFYTARTSDYSLCQFFSDNKLCEEDQERALGLAPELNSIMLETGWKQQHRAPDVLQKQKFVSCNNEKAGRYTIDPWGNVFSCFFRAGDQDFKAGSITSEGIEWTPLYYNMVTRDATTLDECLDCKFLPFCGGGCSMRAFVQKGTFDTNHCGTIKKLMPERIKIYLKKAYPNKF